MKQYQASFQKQYPLLVYLVLVTTRIHRLKLQTNLYRKLQCTVLFQYAKPNLTKVVLGFTLNPKTLNLGFRANLKP